MTLRQGICPAPGFCMRGCDMDVFYKDTVTIYNRYEDKASCTEHWYPTVLQDVRLLITKGANVAKTGLNSADRASMHISTEKALEKPYKKPKEWLETADKSGAFTFGESDFFVEGDTSAEDTAQDDFAEYMKRKYDNCFQVTTVDAYTLIPHLEVGGK